MAAAQLIADALTQGRALEDRFTSAASGPFAELDARDRALARAIATAALRRLGTIRKAVAGFLAKGAPKRSGSFEWILLTGAAQILFLDAPDHASVDLAVRAARADQNAAPYAAVVNGVLRNIIREREAILERSDPLDDDTPSWLAARWRKAYGLETARAIAAAHREEPTLDLSVKSDPEAWAARLGGAVLPTGSVRLETHRAIRDLDGYEAGEWWVQDAAAALPAKLLGVEPGMRVADLCAAPGGKTAELAAAGGRVTAVDRSAERLKRLAANFERLRLPIEIAVADALAFDAPPFDAVLIDAPCSATGTIRRHPDVAWTKRPGDLAALAAQQTQLLDRAIALVKPGGRVVFCTCSLEPEEGEAQIAALLRRNPDIRRVPVEAGEIGGLAECVTSAGDMRTLPCHLRGATPRLSGLDGFFAARLARLR
ncbi:MAG TPA: RsmB/NOP family class I SAM-dependent RNA methyltransferase [Roseiarcus sp.]|nr:RsmB/NOP family class I SAM-dependent RNA methyltransferase [Roseiarcus sp.]